MRLKTIVFLLFSLSFFCSTNSFATHIVGGEMTYTCLGPNAQGVNVFEIQLTVYRDCQNGVPPFDPVANIAIYAADSTLLDSILIAFDPMLDDTIDAVLSNPCLVVPPDVCVHTTTYTATKALPFRPGGYLLAYQRCCRNRTIVNIVRPLSTGATFDIAISDLALSECNTSAKFVDWPPIYICANEPIDFDHSAIDPDGDSIVYKLCTPITGGDSTSALAAPTAFEQTIPEPIVWIDPPFNEGNMLNNPPTGDLLRIDANTGFLTGVPNLPGQFVVGICIEEYRQGILISTTRRDFQYNVGECGSSVSSFFLPQILCDGLTIDFDNQSMNADDYLWLFNDPNNPGASSTLENPMYTYSDTGNYTITLISEPGNQCVDTSEQLVNLQYNSLTASFNSRLTECTDSTSYLFTDTSVDTLFDIISWSWTVWQGSTLVDTSSQQNPTFSFTEEDFYRIELVVTAANGCEESSQFIFRPRVLSIDIVSDTLVICSEDSISLVDIPNDTYNYNWSPADGLDDPTSANPTASPLQTTTYSVTVSDNSGICSIIRSVTVVIPDSIEILLPQDTVICEGSVRVTAISDQVTSYFWSTGPISGPIISFTPSVTLTPSGGSQLFYLRAEDRWGCKALDSIRVTENQVDIQLFSEEVICQGETFNPSIVNSDLSDTLTYNWRPAANILSGGDGANPVFSFPDPGVYQVEVEVNNQFSCIDSATAQFTVLDTTSQIGFLSETQCSGFTIQFTNTSVNAPFYQWNFGDPNDPLAGANEINPSYTYADTGTYVITLTYNQNVDCPDTLRKTIQVGESQINVDFDYDIGECGDSLTIDFRDISTNNQSTFISREWIFSNGSTSTQQDTSLTFFNSQDITASLILISDDGCMDTIEQIIPIQLIEVMLADTLLICNGETTDLNPNGNPVYDYQWSPAFGLSDPTIPNPQVNIASSQNYSVTISDFGSDTCQIVRDVFVKVAPTIDLMVSEDDSSCVDEFTIAANSTIAQSFEWYDDGVLVANTATLTVMPGRENVYEVRAYDQFGCFTTDSVRLQNLNPILRDTTYLLCETDTLQLELGIETSEDQLTYSWSPQSEILSGADTANPLVSPTSTTVYTATVTNEFGCTTSANAIVQIIPNLPVLNASAAEDTIFTGDSVQLTSTMDSTYTYEWSPGNTLSDPNIFNPIARPPETTTYQLRITDGNGCTNVVALTITVISSICDDPVIFLPNAFSQNGDGENDVLSLLGFNVDEMYLAIFNRWGQKVFESTSQDNGWDGTFEGKQLGPDVFGYYLRVKCLTGEDFFKKGNITLIR